MQKRQIEECTKQLEEKSTLFKEELCQIGIGNVKLREENQLFYRKIETLEASVNIFIFGKCLSHIFFHFINFFRK